MRLHPFRLVALSLVAALLGGPVLAQTAPAKPAAKPAVKPAAKAAPGKADQTPAKPRPKLMTRDELRACLARQDASKVEADAISLADKELAAERDRVLAERDVIKQRQAEIEASEKAILDENKRVAAVFESLKEKLPKMSKKEAAEAKEDYEKQAAVVNGQIDPHNTRKRVFVAEVGVFEQRVEKFNKSKDELGARADKLGDAQDAWRSECGNRPYDEVDEIALRKEKEKADKAKAAAQ
jgi:hypothetical protein